MLSSDAIERGLIAEWQPQAGILLAWPHKDTDWADDLPAIEDGYLNFIQAITRFEPVWLVLPAELQSEVDVKLREHGIDTAQVRFFNADYDDTWLRDTAPLSLIIEGQPRLRGFRFDGWGGKYASDRDNELGRLLTAWLGAKLQRRHDQHELLIEGGAVESDGRGRLMTTRSWLQARFPDHMSRDQAERIRNALGGSELLVLENGRLQGDDTDGHIDNLVRFVGRNRLAVQCCDDVEDPSYPALKAMRDELGEWQRTDEKPYEIFELPWPGRIEHEGRQLPASYANFLILNGAVLVPSFGVANDEAALSVLKKAFPKRKVISVPAEVLIRQNGGLHCASMQVAA